MQNDINNDENLLVLFFARCRQLTTTTTEHISPTSVHLGLFKTRWLLDSSPSSSSSDCMRWHRTRYASVLPGLECDALRTSRGMPQHRSPQSTLSRLVSSGPSIPQRKLRVTSMRVAASPPEEPCRPAGPTGSTCASGGARCTSAASHRRQPVEGPVAEGAAVEAAILGPRKASPSRCRPRSCTRGSKRAGITSAATIRAHIPRHSRRLRALVSRAPVRCHGQNRCCALKVHAVGRPSRHQCALPVPAGCRRANRDASRLRSTVTEIDSSSAAYPAPGIVYAAVL